MPAHQGQCCPDLSNLVLIFARSLAVTLAAELLIHENLQSCEAYANPYPQNGLVW